MDLVTPEEEVAALELEAVEEVTGELGLAVTGVVAGIGAAWAGGLAGPALAGLILRRLGGLSWPAMNRGLQLAAVHARDLGVSIGSRGTRVRNLRGPVPEVPDLDRDTRDRVQEAVSLVRTLDMDTVRDRDRAAGRVRAIRSRAEGTVRYTVHDGANGGIAAVARRLRKRIIWLPERDACLHCLAYAGWAVAPDAGFPPGLTYGDRPLREDSVPHPPLHPGCRCSVELHDGPAGPPSDDRSQADAPARLAAEARRSVVYGWTAHASAPATLRAMDRLLTQGAGLAPSVERRARSLLAEKRQK